MSIEDIVDNYITSHVRKLQDLNSHTGICHVNAQSNTSTFDGFQFMVYEKKSTSSPCREHD